MGVALRRTSYSPNIKERADCSAAVFADVGHHGQLAGQLGRLLAPDQGVAGSTRDQPGSVTDGVAIGGKHLDHLAQLGADLQTQRLDIVKRLQLGSCRLTTVLPSSATMGDPPRPRSQGKLVKLSSVCSTLSWSSHAVLNGLLRQGCWR
ncbi:MAG: hypothetical protein ACRDZ4_08840 [Egibacteraceae bacterium]